MKKITKKIILTLAILCMTVMFMPVMAHADGYMATTYDELVQFLNYGGDNWELCPAEDFKWPSGPVSLTISKEVYISKPWTIPSNVTVNQERSGRIRNNNSPIIVNGVWNANNSFDEMKVNSGGKLVVNEDFSVEKSLRIENGGTLLLNDWIAAGEGCTITVKKTAVVTSPNNQGKICIAGGTLSSDGAVISVPVKASAYIYSDKADNIKGKMTVKRLELDGGEKLYVTTGSSLSVEESIYNYEKAYIVVGNKASLNFTGKNYISSTASITVRDGGTVNIKSHFDLTEKGSLTVEKGGAVKAYKPVTLDNGCILKLDAGSNYYQKEGHLFVSAKGFNKGYVKGSGTITLSAGCDISDGLKCVASTIKVKRDNSGAVMKKGTVFSVGNNKYTVTTTGKEIALSGVTRKSLTSVEIPGEVVIKGISYKVTAISPKAFYGCSKLKTITIRNLSITSVGKDALKGTPKKMTIKVLKKKYSAYKKLLANKGNTTIVVKYF